MILNNTRFKSAFWFKEIYYDYTIGNFLREFEIGLAYNLMLFFGFYTKSYLWNLAKCRLIYDNKVFMRDLSFKTSFPSKGMMSLSDLFKEMVLNIIAIVHYFVE